MEVHRIASKRVEKATSWITKSKSRLSDYLKFSILNFRFSLPTKQLLGVVLNAFCCSETFGMRWEGNLGKSIIVIF